jgi:hypothetical protein
MFAVLQSLVSRVDSYMLWAFNPQPELSPRVHPQLR